MNKVIHSRYQHIKERCYNPNSKSYKRYGGRGISMCDEWLNSYQAFEEWCLSHGFENNLAIDRIDNDGDYSPENCRFVTLKENNQKRRTTVYYTIDGITKNLQQWCDYYNINRGTVVTRLKNGWTIEDALTKPVKKERDRTSLIGKRFAKLLVEAYAGDEYIGADNNSPWLCLCDCGNHTIASTCKLKSGHTTSCGCTRRENIQNINLYNNPSKKETNRQRMREHNPNKYIK